MSKKFLTNKKEKVTLKPSDFEKVFNEELSDAVKERIKEYNFTYYNVTSEERDQCIKKAVSFLIDDNVIRAGEQRIDQWESGWKENLDKLMEHFEFKSIIPRYFGKYDVVRFDQKYIIPASENFEYNMLVSCQSTFVR